MPCEAEDIHPPLSPIGLKTGFTGGPSVAWNLRMPEDPWCILQPRTERAHLCTDSQADPTLGRRAYSVGLPNETRPAA